MEPQERINTYARRIGRGKPFPESLEHNEGSNPCPILNVQLWELADDVPKNAVSVRWPRPWYLLEPWSTTQLFLVAWCQSNSRLLSSST
jgi:hypothetical protein